MGAVFDEVEAKQSLYVERQRRALNALLHQGDRDELH
jgi:hypothetical protein